jgi:hypothetical protein
VRQTACATGRGTESTPCRLSLAFDDLMAYKRKDDEARAKILDQLTAEAQELVIGY